MRRRRPWRRPSRPVPFRAEPAERDSRRRGAWQRRAKRRRPKTRTASATSPTPSSATSSRFSPPRKAPVPRSSPPGGATSGGPPRLSISIAMLSVSHGKGRFSSAPCQASVTIDNAPSLEKLLNLNLAYALHVTVVSAPKLETVGYVSDFHRGDMNRLVFGSTIIQGLHLDSMAARICTVKTLAVNMKSAPSLNDIIDMLRCFPCLEKLYIKLFLEKEILCRFGSSWLSIPEPSLDIPLKLKKIVLDRYQGTYSSGCRGDYSEVDFAKFFVLNASQLESMTFRVDAQHYNEKFFARERMALRYEKRASRGAQYHFTIDRRYIREVDEFKHASDLDLTDPFLRRSSSGSFCRLV